MSAARIKVGIIGVGRMGELHLTKLLAIPDADCVGIYDVNGLRASEVAAKYNVRAFSRLVDLFFETDAVFIAATTRAHFVLARQALQEGLDVFVEKPLVPTLTEAEILLSLAEKHSRILQVGHIERFRCRALLGGYSPSRPVYLRADRLALAPGRESDVDVVTDLMVHDLDLVLSLVGERPVFFSVSGNRVRGQHHDVASVRIEFPGGAVADLFANRFSAVKRREMTFLGAKLLAGFDWLQNRAVFRRLDGKAVSEQETRELSEFDALLEQNRSFLFAVRERTNPVVSGADALLVMQSVVEIRRRLMGETPPLVTGPTAYDGSGQALWP